MKLCTCAPPEFDHPRFELTFSLPLPLPPEFLKISGISNLQAAADEFPRKILIAKILCAKILKA